MIGPLSGYTIGVTADRRSDEQISLLTGRGAECLHGPMVQTHPLRPEAEIRAATELLLDQPPDFFVATTGLGVRGWMAAADALRLGESLRSVLSSSRIFARGRKAHGSVVTAGLEVEWTTPRATSAELSVRLLDVASPGDRVAVQVDGGPDQPLVRELHRNGFDVVPVPVYQWTMPKDIGTAESLIQMVAERRLDAVTFTARPAIENFVQLGEALGLMDEVRAAATSSVTICCVGPVCAQGATDLGLGVPVQPERPRLGAMVQTITSALECQSRLVDIGGHQVGLQGQMVAVAGSPPVKLTGRERQILDVLVDPPGPVVSKGALLRQVWGSAESDPHVVEVTVARLRRKLGSAGIGIETVIRRGYRVSAN